MGLEPNFTNNRLLGRSSLLPRVIFSATWPNWIGKFKTPWWFHDTWKMRNKHVLTIQSWCMLKKWWMFFVEWWLQTGLQYMDVLSVLLQSYSIIDSEWEWYLLVYPFLDFRPSQQNLSKERHNTSTTPSAGILPDPAWLKIISPLYRPFWWSIIWITKLVPPQISWY